MVYLFIYIYILLSIFQALEKRNTLQNDPVHTSYLRSDLQAIDILPI